MSEAIQKLVEGGLEHFEQPKRRGPKDRWGDGRYIVLHREVCEIRDELQNGRKSKVSIEEAVKVLRDRAPTAWTNAESSLVTKFYEAERRLESIFASYAK
jgi:hypothetical protein